MPNPENKKQGIHAAIKGEMVPPLPKLFKIPTVKKNKRTALIPETIVVKVPLLLLNKARGKASSIITKENIGSERRLW